MRRFKNKVINFFRETQEEVKGVKKGAITALCYMELLIIAALLGLCLVMNFQVALSSALVDQVTELKDEALIDRDEALTDRDEALSDAIYYRYMYEDIKDAYELYQEEHPNK